MAPTQSLKTTRQRQIILEELKKMSSHPTADELYEMVRRRIPRVSLGTVYRNLELLSGSNAIQTLPGGTKMRFDGNPQQHYHFRCVSCDRVDDLPLEPLTRLEDDLRSISDYDIQGHRLEFFGLCPQCKRQA